MSAGEDDATFQNDESLKMEEKHGDNRNMASSHGCKYFMWEIPQGFFHQ